MSIDFASSVVRTGGDFAWMLYDLKKCCIVEQLCDYAASMVDKAQLTLLTVNQEMGHLKVFWIFLKSRSIELEKIANKDIEDFRDFAFKQVLNGVAHRGSEDAAKTTVNAKLVRIYDWLMWMQETNRMPANSIGARFCKVTSALESSSICCLRPRDPHIHSSSRYPLCYRIKSGKSKHSLSKFIPTEETLDAVHAYFFEKCETDFIAHRNCLIADIASYSGFRRGSIQSLTTKNFVGKNGVDFVETKNETVLIRPSRQKFSYENVFELPNWLHDAAKEFIYGQLFPLIESLGVSTHVHRDALFISSRNGKALTDQAMTALMSKALRSLGAPKGTAMHAWRAKFAVEETANEYQTRRELGLDTSIGTMDTVVARKLGHKNSTSVRAYTSAHEAAEVSRHRAQRENERNTDKLRIKALEAELVTLRSMRPELK